MNIQDILARVEGAKPCMNGWQGRCPAHDDRVASLSISNGGGKILLHCHAGCPVEAIVELLGLRMSDLFTEPKPAPSNLRIKGSPVIKIYNYYDAENNLSYRVLRSADKSFSQQRLTDEGQWEWKGPKTKLLYRLPELLADESDQIVFIVEGEKDVDSLKKIGLSATCNTGGAGKFKQDNSALRGRRVVILPDNDAAGRDHATDVARKIEGIAESIFILPLPNLPAKGDVSDWLTAGGTRDQLLELVDAAIIGRPIFVSPEIFKPSDTLLQPKDLSAMGLAARFHAEFFRTTRYVESRSTFYNYEGGVWIASKCLAEVKVKRIINEVLDEVTELQKKVETLRAKQAAGDNSVLADLGDASNDLKQLSKFASTIKQSKTMDSVLTFARSDMMIAQDDFDPDDDVINVGNGIINLRNGKLMPHQGESLCSMKSPVIYQAGAQCERWLRFLDEIFLGDQELIGFMQRLVGYSISGDTSEEIFPILHGDGANGKTELLWVLKQISGSYLRSAEVATFMDDKQNGGHNEDVARLRGCRIVTTSETEKTKRLAEALVKRLTGRDVITASYKHERTFEFTPRFKVWLAANHKPVITGTDYGIWRRILLIPFHAKFLKPGTELSKNQFHIDENLRDDLSRELSGILNWAIAGYQQWRQHGLKPPAIVKAASEEYRQESDKLGAFLGEEMLEILDGAPATLASAYEAYRAWCERGGMKAGSIRAFAADLRARQIDVRKHGMRNDTCVVGYALRLT